MTINQPSPITPEQMAIAVQDLYDLTPKGMIEYLKPNDPKNLLNSTNYGHFGGKDVSWEKIDEL